MRTLVQGSGAGVRRLYAEARRHATAEEHSERVEVLTTAVPPEAREAWYERQLKMGMQVCLAHPKLVATGLDYVEYEARCHSLFLLKPVGFRRLEISERAGTNRSGRECAFPIRTGIVNLRRQGGSVRQLPDVSIARFPST